MRPFAAFLASRRGRSVTPKAVKTGAQGSPTGQGFLTRLRREKPLAVVLGIVLLLLILVALFADVLAPFAPNEVFLMDRLQGSSVRYPLGTDQLGRDFMSRLIYGARLTLAGQSTEYFW